MGIPRPAGLLKIVAFRTPRICLSSRTTMFFECSTAKEFLSRSWASTPVRGLSRDPFGESSRSIIICFAGRPRPLTAHQAICNSPFKGRIIPTFRPDSVVDPDFEGFAGNIASLGQITGEDTQSWRGYLNALKKRRLHFKSLGCTATDHGHPTAATADLSSSDAGKLFARVVSGESDANEGELFRAQMLTEMARMSLEDGLVMQIHPGSFRNHNLQLFQRYGRDMGADIPTPTD